MRIIGKGGLGIRSCESDTGGDAKNEQRKADGSRNVTIEKKPEIEVRSWEQDFWGGGRERE